MERTPMSAKSQGIFSSAVTDDEFGMVYYHYGPPIILPTAYRPARKKKHHHYKNGWRQ